MDKELRFMTLIKGKKKCDLLGWGHLVYAVSLSLFLCVFNKTKPKWTDGFVMVVCLLLENATLHAFFFLLQAMFCFVLFLLEATKGCWGYFWLLWRPKGNNIVLGNEHKCFPVMLWGIHAVFFFLVGLLTGAAFNPFMFAENATVWQ